MIVVIKKNQDKKQIENLTKWIKGLGLGVHISEGENSTVIGLIGDTSKIDIDLIRSLDIVESVTRVQEPYKNVNRKFHPDDTIIDVCGHKFGGGSFQIIAGPCSVET
ncbi:MAG: 3-deoxy-7-phosphoheptulonate synthase, partial [Clostridia bacterium]